MGKKNIVWNDYISQNERFADFFNGVVFQGRQFVLPENLTKLDTKLRRRQQERGSYHEYIRDTVKLWEYKGKRYLDLREVFGFLKRQGNKEKLRQYVEENEAFRHLKEDAFDVLCTYSKVKELAIKKEEYRTKGGMDMCTALRELKEEVEKRAKQLLMNSFTSWLTKEELRI